MPFYAWNESSVTVSYDGDRVYVYYIGVLKYLNLEMECSDNSTDFSHPSCFGEFDIWLY